MWLWKKGAFELYRRKPEGKYDRIDRSGFLPQLDLSLVARFVTRRDQDKALHEFADIVRAL